ncbi:MAG: CDP-alcohol phosphatidyltransferase family protein [Gammaproteobacteria bacterium]|nr:MAG: CDP-alcohol phosphatidyltransferase family protein [Gammaproteobacteria bacterium]
MANLITLSRLLLLIVVVVVAYQPPSWWQFLNVPLLIVVFVTDGLDGYVARRRGETSLFGAMLDIAGDRIVELTMWIVLADLDLLPVWVPLVFVIRGTIVDAIRASQTASSHQSPFAMMQSALGRWLVAGKFMRIFYAVLKAHAFCWLLFIQPMPALIPQIWAQWGALMTGIGAALVYLSVAICLVRGLPVIVEFAYQERHTLLGKLMPQQTGRH